MEVVDTRAPVTRVIEGRNGGTPSGVAGTMVVGSENFFKKKIFLVGIQLMSMVVKLVGR